MKTTLHVITVVYLVVMATISVKGWYYDPDMMEAEFTTIEAINHVDGTSEVTVVFEANHPVELAAGRVIVAVFYEESNKGWTGKVDLRKIDNEFIYATKATEM